MRRERRMERILDAGAHLLAERGIHGCTMRDVAERAGSSPASLYRYVQGKEELLYLVVERVLERAIRSAEAALAVRGAREQLKSYVTDHIRRVLAFPAEVRLLQESPDVLPDHLRRRIEKRRRTYLDMAADIVGGVLRGEGTRRATSMRYAQLLLGMADRVALDGAWQDPKPRPDRLARPVLDVFLRGVRGKGG
jgi:AcrR family transcriptional regulator